MGDATIAITFDLYGHLMPGSHDEAAGLLDAFLARQVGGAEGERTEARRRTRPHHIGSGR